MRNKTITVVGSLNVDLVVRTRKVPGAGETVAGTGFAKYVGGKGANQAAAAAKLRADTRVDATAVRLIGRVGRDSEGAHIVGALTALGVDTSGVGQDDGAPTGIAAITVDDRTGENRIVLVAGANDALSPGALAVHHDVLASADVLLLQLEIPLPTVQTATRMGREKHARVILDPAPARTLPPSLLRLCDYVTPNETELGVLTGRADAATALLPLDEITRAAATLAAQGARNVIVKLGARGALLLTDEGATHVPAFAVDAVDTTAAGDVFNAAFAVALSEGQAQVAAVRFAAAAAALSVTRKGALASVPSRDEVDAFLAARPIANAST